MAREEQGTVVPFAGEQGKFMAIQNFAGINNKAGRSAIKDEQFAWLENAMPIGDGNLRATPSNGAAVFTAAGALTIIYIFPFNIGTNTFVAIFLSDGSAIQMNTVTLATVTIGAAGTFWNGGSIPACAQWGNSGILIVSKISANAYWAWDGTLWPPGNATSPAWLNGGVATAMPNGISGTAIEIYQARVWIANGSLVFFSSPGDGASFSGSLGGGAFTSSDSFLKSAFGAIRQANGFLYLFGDSSINVVSNVQSSGSPIVTTFNNQNIDPQVGTSWPNSVAAFGRGLVFANQRGVFALFGGAAEKISDDLDGTFGAIQALLAGVTPTTQPSAALVMLFSIRVYCLLIPVFDPLTGANRNVLATWDGKKWFMLSQDATLDFVATQEINSVLTGWGTDTKTLFRLFQTTTTTLNKIIQTKLWAGDAWLILKATMRLYMQGQDNSGGGYFLTGTLDQISDTGSDNTPFSLFSHVNIISWFATGGAELQWTGAGGAELNFGAAGLTVSGIDMPGSGAVIGLTLQSTSPDFTIVALALLYKDQSAIGG
jgi:hypothetical protein